VALKWPAFLKPFTSYGLIPLLCAVVSWRKGQDIDWDVQNYHLYNAWAFVHDRFPLDLAPAGVQTFFNPLFDLFWYALVATLPPAAVGATLGLVHGINFVLVRAIALHFLPPEQANRSWLSWLLALAGVLSAGFLSELGTAMHDNLVALAVLTSLLLCLRAQERPAAATATLTIAGAVAGFACAAKLISAPFALALCTALFVAALPHERHWRARLLPAVAFSTGVVVSLLAFGGYWYWYNWHHYGNPLFPSFNNVFGGELGALDTNRDERFLPKTLADWLFRPVLMSKRWRLVAEVPYRQISFGVVYLLAIAAAAWWCWRSRVAVTVPARKTLLLIVFTATTYLLWLKIFGIYRYLIALELLLPLLCLLLWRYLLGQRRGTVFACGSLLLMTLTGVASRTDWGHADWRDQYYALDPPADRQQVGTVLLMGQPLAWLAPAFDLPVPFLQLDPNFSHQGSGYDAELLRRVNHQGNIRLIFDPALYRPEQIAGRLAENRMMIAPGSCEPLRAYLGAQLLQYQYCKVQPLS